MRQIHAIITDLDRTLLHTDKSVSTYTIQVFQRCRNAEIHIFAATARPERSVRIYDRILHFDAMTIMNGARILLADRELRFMIPRTSGTAILKRICSLPDNVLSVELEDGLFANVDIPEWKPVVYPGFPELPGDGGLYKILVSSPHEELYRQIGRMLTEDTYYTTAGNMLIQIMSRDATKWNGVQQMLSACGISPADAVYFGDDMDDLESIRMCGIGAAVASGAESVQQAADVIVGSHDEDGVARFIENTLLF